MNDISEIQRLADGASVATVGKSVGLSQSTVTLYLNEIEGQIKCKVVRRTGGIAGAAKVSVLRVERANGLRRASVRDLHSLRVTWVRLALTAGVPLELVAKLKERQGAGQSQPESLSDCPAQMLDRPVVRWPGPSSKG